MVTKGRGQNGTLTEGEVDQRGFSFSDDGHCPFPSKDDLQRGESSESGGRGGKNKPSPGDRQEEGSRG